MNHTESILELFAPLSARLSAFEIKSFPDELTPPEYMELMDTISARVAVFSPETVLPLLEKSLQWCNRIQERIQSIDTATREKWSGEEYFKESAGIHFSVPEESLAFRIEYWNYELNYYIHSLQQLRKIKTELQPTGAETAPMAPATVINLPDNFTVSELNKHFAPQLSLKQAALLLYYLRDAAVLPPYSDAAIGRLAEVFFVRNRKNVTTGLTNIYAIRQEREELSALKEVITGLLDQIDADLKKAK